MANTYFDKTGLLIFTGEPKLTPVLKALFGPYEPDSDGTDKPFSVMIKEVAEESDVTWEAVAESIEEQAASFGKALPPEQDRRDVAVWISWLAEALGVSDGRWNHYTSGDLDPVSDAPLIDLFTLAIEFNDGHNLVAIETAACWHSDKARLFEFGGIGAFYSQLVEVVSSSDEPREVGRKLHDSLSAGHTGVAAEVVLKAARDLLDSIQDPDSRAAVRQQLVDKMTREFGRASH